MSRLHYRVKNLEGLPGRATYTSARAAVDDMEKREGAGWVVIDDNGQTWERNGSAIVCVEDVNAWGDL